MLGLTTQYANRFLRSSSAEHNFRLAQTVRHALAVRQAKPFTRRFSNMSRISAAAQSIYEFKIKDITGQEVDFEKFKDKVVLVVNVASQCGFTPQYQGLQALYDTYKNDGFEIVAFPCNQFGQQEPGSKTEIQRFAENQGATFAIMTKVDVNGPQAEPLFRYLKEQQGGILGSDIKWNFTKFLVDRQGVVRKRYSSVIPPEQLENDVKNLL